MQSRRWSAIDLPALAFERADAINPPRSKGFLVCNRSPSLKRVRPNRRARPIHMHLECSMKKLLSALISASLVLAPLTLVPSTASAKTANQKKNEAKGAAAKQKSAAKSAARKKK
jgi:hypothetical protein